MSGGGATDLEESVSSETLTPEHGTLANRVAVITGGTRGIGRGIAEAFLAQGATVVVTGKSEAKGKQAVDEMGGERVAYMQCDVRDQVQIEHLIDETVRIYGRIDVLVNNAGGTDGWALVHELSDDAWFNALNWNLNAVFWASRRALRYMIDQGRGRIINISSVEGKQANKLAVSHYITNKHAINGLTKAIAFEYGPQGVTCNAICPGAIETDLMKEAGPGAAASAGITYEQFLDNYAKESAIKRLNTVEEVAAMAALLASEIGGGITGALINVDGGTAQW
jgi:3-hydroxybutyrate dehydrogenase/3-oxoacyl-[acyl-carrier protein] reductase